MWSAPRLVQRAATEAIRIGVGVAEASISGLSALPGRRGRRVWVGGSRAWVEVPDRGSESYAGLAVAVAESLSSRPYVMSVEVNEVVQRLCVTLDLRGDQECPGEERVTLTRDSPIISDLLALVDAVEDRWWAQHPATRPSPAAIALPGDPDTLAFRAAAVAADVVGLGGSIAGDVLRLPRLPLLAPAATTFVDTQPRLRGVLERRWGKEQADALIGATNAMLQGLARTTPALVVDLAARSLSAAEAHANRVAWAAQEPRLAAHASASAVPPYQRPRPRPEGTIGQYSTLAAAGSVLAGAAFLARGNPYLAGSAVLAGAPKAASYGRESFGATVGRLLCQQESGLLLRGEVLRLLDQVDVVVIDPRTMVGRTCEVGDLDGVTDADGRTALWRAAVADVSEGLLDPGWHPRSALSPRHDGLRLPDSARLLVTRTPEPLALEIVAAARAARLAVFSLDVDWLGSLRGGFDELVAVELSAPTEEFSRESTAQGQALNGALADLVSRCQADGHTVAVIAGADAAEALSRADIGIGVGPSTAWTADVLVPGLGAAWRLVNAVPAARTLTRRVVELSVGGTLLESLLLLTGGRRRWPGPVTAAGAMGLLSGRSAAARVMAAPLPPVVPSLAWHAMSAQAVQQLLLTPTPRHQSPPPAQADVAQTRPGGPSLGRRLLTAVREDLDDPLSPVLATGAAASAIMGSPADALLVSSVMVGNAVLSGAQRVRAADVLSRLLVNQEVRARVVTGSPLAEPVRCVEVSALDLCVGELIEVRHGQTVPADARIIVAEGVEVDESSLTGESAPVVKQEAATPGAPLAERACMIYEGTVVLAGRVVGVVTATGPSTEAGRAMALWPGSRHDVGLPAQLARLTGSVLPLTVAGGLGVVGLGLMRGTGLRQAVASGLAITVAAVPEGLPLIATLAQQAAARRLSGAGVLVRSPAAVEALGRVGVVCFDKTGTLTQNRLTVHTARPMRGVSMTTLLWGAGLAAPACDDDDVHRHATDAAVASYCADYRPTCQASLPFRAGRPFAVGLSGSDLAVKGAPEVVLAACVNAGAHYEEVDQLAKAGLRVLAVATRELSATQTRRAVQEPAELEGLAAQGLRLLGFLGIADTVRPGAKALLETLISNDTRPVLITGDHPLTAAAIARELGLPVTDDQVVTGDQWSSLPRKARRQAVRRATVFARMSPEQKVQIVQELEGSGLVCAMVGDGANDAAAIRAATVGVGVATSGSDPARGAADVILLNGDVAALTTALEEGTQLWQRVQAAVTMLLGGNAGEVAFTALGVALTGRAPLNSRQLLLVNLFTDALPAAAIAVSPPRPGAHRARGLDEEQLWQQVLERGATTTLGASSAWAIGRLTGRPARASTIGLVALVATQLGQTVVDSPTPLVIATAGGSLAALGIAVSVPVVSQAVGCTPLGPLAWTQALSCAAAATAAGVVLPGLRDHAARLMAPGLTRAPHATAVNEPVATASGPDHRASASATVQ